MKSYCLVVYSTSLSWTGVVKDEFWCGRSIYSCNWGCDASLLLSRALPFGRVIIALLVTFTLTWYDSVWSRLRTVVVHRCECGDTWPLSWTTVRDIYHCTRCPSSALRLQYVFKYEVHILSISDCVSLSQKSFPSLQVPESFLLKKQGQYKKIKYRIWLISFCLVKRS